MIYLYYVLVYGLWLLVMFPLTYFLLPPHVTEDEDQRWAINFMILVFPVGAGMVIYFLVTFLIGSLGKILSKLLDSRMNLFNPLITKAMETREKVWPDPRGKYRQPEEDLLRSSQADERDLLNPR